MKKAVAAAEASSGFPSFDWIAAIQSFVFFTALLISSYTFQWVLKAHSTVASLAIAIVMLISISAAPLLFVFQALGLGKAQFWRALITWPKRPKENYPFTSLISCLEHDAAHRHRLDRFHTDTLQVVLDRISYEETDLRERLATFLGSPTPLLMFGVIGGVFSGWESYRAHPESMAGTALFAGSLVTLLLGMFGLSQRAKLFELSWCRGLLALEIARRTALSEKRQLRSKARSGEPPGVR